MPVQGQPNQGFPGGSGWGDTPAGGGGSSGGGGSQGGGSQNPNVPPAAVPVTSGYQLQPFSPNQNLIRPPVYIEQQKPAVTDTLKNNNLLPSNS
jgi:hypothetical protein